MIVQRGCLQAQQTGVYIMLETQGRAVRNVELDLGFGRSEEEAVRGLHFRHKKHSCTQETTNIWLNHEIVKLLRFFRSKLSNTGNVIGAT